MSKRLNAINTYKSNLFNRLAAVNPRLSDELQAIRLPWYTVMNVTGDDADDTTEVYIYDEIGGSFGVSASAFIEELNTINTSTIDVRINSPGGNLFDSIAIHNALVKHPAQVNVYVDSLAASGASIVAVAGDQVVMMPGSQMMIHDALGDMLGGNQRDYEGMGTFLGRQSENIAEMYTFRAGGTVKEWRDRMLAETWMFASEAVELGLADRVYKRNEDENPEESNQSAKVHEEVPLKLLMERKHNLKDRGYKYINRDAAPAPQVQKQNFAAMANVMKSTFS